MKYWGNINSDKKAGIIIFFSLIFIQLLYVFFKSDYNYLFGVEYGNIAQNFVSGKGYSNPLPTGDTGPTAWVPPILVLLISFGFLLFGKTAGAFIFLSLFKFITYAIVFYFLLKTLRLVNIKINRTIAIAVFLLYIGFSPSDNFESIHDFWLPQLLVMLFLYHTLKLQLGDKINYFALFLIIFLAPLINPIFSLCFMVILGIQLIIVPIISAFSRKEKILLTVRKDFFYFIGFCLIFGLSISIWTLRNYLVFDKFIPTKSNMWFEFYLANVVDTDGKLSQSALYKAHPIYDLETRKQMASEGEIKWLDKYKNLCSDYLAKPNNEYYQKMLNRLLMAVLYTETDRDNIRSEGFDHFSEADREKLLKNKFIIGQDWMTGFYENEKLIKELNLIGIEDIALVAADWNSSKNRFIKSKYSISNFTRSIFFGIIPALSILILLLFFKAYKNPMFLYSIIVYFIYLIPYVLISHQIRYQRPLFIIQVILIYFVLVKTYDLMILNKKLPHS